MYEEIALCEERVDTVTYSLLDIIVHMFDMSMLRTLDCPCCIAYELQDRATEEGLPFLVQRSGFHWTATIGPVI